MHPSATAETKANGIDGDTIVGMYSDGSARGYAYSISTQTYTPVDVPGASSTSVNAINGSRMVGTSVVGGLWRAFLFSGTTFTTLPAASLNADKTFGVALHGNLIGGLYTTATTGNDRFSMLYDTVTEIYTQFTLPLPDVKFTWIAGISDDYFTGTFIDTNDVEHAFLYARSGGQTSSIDAPGAAGGTYGGGVSGNHFVVTGFDADFVGSSYVYSAVPVPEPSTYAMALAGLACGGYSRWRRRKRV